MEAVDLQLTIGAALKPFAAAAAVIALLIAEGTIIIWSKHRHLLHTVQQQVTREANIDVSITFKNIVIPVF